MFKSEPICILSAGKTVDGREVTLQQLNEMAEDYDPVFYNARINYDHYSWGEAGGDVLSLSVKEEKLWAVIKPNSHLLSNIERGQRLHTSVEFEPKLPSTGRAYLTGLAFTDRPASTGTTRVSLSAHSQTGLVVSTGETFAAQFKPEQADQTTFFNKLMKLLSTPTTELDSVEPPKETDDMNEEIKVLLTEQLEANKSLTEQLSKLATTLSAQQTETQTETETETETDPAKELNAQITSLTEQVSELKTALSKITDDQSRRLSTGGESNEVYL